MSTTLFPDADISTNGWGVRGANNRLTQNYFPAIAEETSDGDASFIFTNNPLSEGEYQDPYKCKLQAFNRQCGGGTAIVTAKCPTAIPGGITILCHPVLKVEVLDDNDNVLGHTCMGPADYQTVTFDVTFPNNTPPANIFMKFSPVRVGGSEIFFCCVTQAILVINESLTLARK